MTKFIKYTHASGQGYSTTKNYRLDAVLKDMKLEDVKVFFTPVNFEWDKPKKIKEPKVIEKVIENTEKVDKSDD